MSTSSAEETIESSVLGADKTTEVEHQMESSQHLQVSARLQENQNQEEAESTFYRVSVSYPSEMPDELQLDEGDIVEVLSKRPDGFWTGILRDKVGLFPSSFVTPMTSDQVQKDNLKYCKVLYNCAPEHDDELQLRANDIVEVIAKFEDGWWKGRLGNKVGVFPANFVIMIPTPTTTRTATTSETTSSENALMQCIVVVPYPGNDDEELTLEIGDVITIVNKDARDGGLWWKGVLRGKTGIFPKSFVKELTLRAATEQNREDERTSATNNPTDTEDSTKLEPRLTGNVENNPSSSGPCNLPSLDDSGEEPRMQCIVTASYESDAFDELTLKKGDVVTVLSKDGCWWKGKLRNNDGYKTGLFPKSFVEELTSETLKKQDVSTSSVPNVDESFRRLLEEEITKELKKANEEKNKCIICMDCDINAAFFPCGHLTCCVECAHRNEVCPLCRNTIEKIERIYLPG